MPTYVYCLLTAGADAPVPPPGLSGLDGAPVRRVACGTVDAWASDSPVDASPRGATSDPERLVRRARAHDGVSAAALAMGVTPLPVRFGQVYASDAACAAAIGARADVLGRALARVARHVEMTAMVPLSPEAAAPASAAAVHGGDGPGRSYLEAVRQKLAPEMRYLESAVRRRITETVGALARDEVVAVAGHPSPSAAPPFLHARHSHLVPRDAVSAYRLALARLSDELFGDADPPRAIRVLGPSAPSSFALPDDDRR